MRNWSFADVAAHWDSVSYDEANSRIDSYMRRFVDSCPLFSIPSSGNVLDVDCRTGNGTVFFQRTMPNATFTCLAMAESFEAIARRRFAEYGVSAEVRFLRGIPLDLATNSFDVVLSFETIEHVPEPAGFLQELARVLRPGGILVLTTPNRLWEPVHWLSAALHLDHGEGPHRMLPRRELLDHIHRAGLTVVREESFVLVPAGPRWLVRFGKWVEALIWRRLLRTIALRRTLICGKPP